MSPGQVHEQESDIEKKEEAHHSRDGSEELLSRGVATSVLSLAVSRADRERLLGRRLGVVHLEVAEDVGGRKGRGRPDDLEAREAEGEEHELGLDVRVVQRGRRELGRRVGLVPLLLKLGNGALRLGHGLDRSLHQRVRA